MEHAYISIYTTIVDIKKYGDYILLKTTGINCGHYDLLVDPIQVKDLKNGDGIYAKGVLLLRSSYDAKKNPSLKDACIRVHTINKIEYIKAGE